jgi:hypothetical protein
VLMRVIWLSLKLANRRENRKLGGGKGKNNKNIQGYDRR